MTAADDTERACWAAIDARPGDTLQLSILADYLDERGRGDETDALRWCVETGRVPEKGTQTRCGRSRRVPFPDGSVHNFAGHPPRHYDRWFWEPARGSVPLYELTRPFRNWLPAHLWRWYGVPRCRMRRVGHRSPAVAYQAVCALWRGCLAHGTDPRTGERLAAGRRESDWW